MAGHSKFKNIQHRKESQDKKKAKLFVKLVHELFSAVKSGGIDQVSNSRLRNAIINAKHYNLPKDRIDKAILQASNSDSKSLLFEMRYEAFIPGGIAFIIESLTNKKNRAIAYIRSIFSKFGGKVIDSGGASFLFNRVGRVVYSRGIASDEDILEVALEGGAVDIISDNDKHDIYTSSNSFNYCIECLRNKYGDPQKSFIYWQPYNVVIVTDKEKGLNLIKLVNLLEEGDDIQNVFSNYQLSEQLKNELL